jgi:hypothetical protein
LVDIVNVSKKTGGGCSLLAGCATVGSIFSLTDPVKRCFLSHGDGGILLMMMMGIFIQ